MGPVIASLDSLASGTDSKELRPSISRTTEISRGEGNRFIWRTFTHLMGTLNHGFSRERDNSARKKGGAIPTPSPSLTAQFVSPSPRITRAGDRPIPRSVSKIRGIKYGGLLRDADYIDDIEKLSPGAIALSSLSLEQSYALDFNARVTIDLDLSPR